jgi:hypothetical protein
MTFQEQLRDQLFQILLPTVPEEKKEEFTQAFEASVAPVFETMGKTFEKYDKDIKRLKEMKQASSDAPAGIDPRDYEEMQHKAEAYEEQASQLATAQKELSRKLNAAEKKAQEMAEKLQKESSDLNSTLLSNELRRAMGVLSLAEGSSDEVYDILSKNVRVMQDEKGSRRIAAVVRDPTGVELEKPLSEYVKGWADTSALAKRVLVAPRNSGTGGQGSQGTVGAAATLEAQYQAALARGDVASAMMLKVRLSAEA